MCYSDNLLSAYVDGELSLGLSKEISLHLRECDHCCEVVQRFDTLGESLRNSEGLSAENVALSQREVWKRVQLQVRREEKSVGIPFRYRRIQLPVPLAAGLMVLFSALLLAAWFYPRVDLPDGTDVLISQQAESDEFTMRTSMNNGTSPQQLEELVRFLSEQGAAVEINIELPGSSHYEVIGEPQLI